MIQKKLASEVNDTEATKFIDRFTTKPELVKWFYVHFYLGVSLTLINTKSTHLGVRVAL